MTLHLGISHLTMLLAVAETGSLTSAARRLGLTQPAISHRLREAERRIGGPLFIRDQRGLRVTPAGERLLRSASLIVRELERAEREAEAVADGVPSTIRVGSRAYTFHHWTREFLIAAREALPRVEIELMPRVSTDPTESLLDSRIDVAIVPFASARSGLEVVPLFEDEIVAIVHPEHAWTSRARIDAADFRHEVYIAYGEAPEHESEYDLFLKAQAVNPQRFLRVGLVDAVIEFVAAGYGVSLLSNWSTVRSSTSGRIVRRRLAGDGTALSWSAVIRSTEDELSPVRRFCHTLAHWSAMRLEMVGAHTVSCQENP